MDIHAFQYFNIILSVVNSTPAPISLYKCIRVFFHIYPGVELVNPMIGTFTIS